MPKAKVRTRTWRELADEVLTAIYQAAKEEGREVTLAEVREAYPFGQRAMWPYNVWLQEVRWFRRGCPDRSRKKRPTPPLDGQEPLL